VFNVSIIRNSTILYYQLSVQYALRKSVYFKELRTLTGNLLFVTYLFNDSLMSSSLQLTSRYTELMRSVIFKCSVRVNVEVFKVFKFVCVVKCVFFLEE
jgi:hypothetical protein